MQSPLRSQVSGWVGVAGAAGMLVSVLMLSGCPARWIRLNSDDVRERERAAGRRAATRPGGSTGTGGSSGNCTGNNDGADIIMTNCATTSCHIPGARTTGLGRAST